MRLGIAALTLGFGLGVIGLVSAQESDSFFPRVFSAAPKKVEPAKKADDKKTDVPKTPAASENRVKKAKADLERRQDVCLKLRGIGIDSGDDELVRRAEALHQRAWDLYVATTNRARESERPLGEISAKELGLSKSTKKGDR
ncbi:MAG: hypothetical protein EXR98_06775 [Gemmataceae bacterium]|nr:hypothetical protein [Gemmataceae bacterium]